MYVTEISQSVVDDVQELINDNINLPIGYSITYGGQFENLQSAKARLWVAVPIALLLIFILLYFAFNSVREALLIYSAIPLAAIGGVLLLWIRGMPFSISAGVGFIALFGIAVLNGIVLIEHFKELKKQSFDSMEALIKQGTKDRLRAVLLTASAAALGFLPMAISTNAGAEVQRPLATVVIGGLITATLLTLVVLPVLYSIFDKKDSLRKKTANPNLTVLLVLVALSFSSLGNAQEKPLDLEKLIPMAFENNAGLKAADLNVQQSDALIGSAFNFDKTQVYYHYDQNNLSVGNLPLNVLGVQQDFLFPTVYFAGRKVNKATYEMTSSAYAIRKKVLERDVTAAFYQYQYTKQKEAIYDHLDSLYQNFAHMANRRFELGETNYLEKITASSKQRQVQIALEQAKQDATIAKTEIVRITQIPDSINIIDIPIGRILIDVINTKESIEMQYYRNNQFLTKAKRQLEVQKLLPDLSLNYFQGTNSALDGSLYGYQAGLKIPLLFGGKASQIKASKISEKIAEEESKDYEVRLNARRSELQAQLDKYDKALTYYETEGTQLSEEILKTATISFKNGEIDFFQYIQSLQNAYEIKLDYLDNLYRYNQTVINLNYLTL